MVQLRTLPGACFTATWASRLAIPWPRARTPRLRRAFSANTTSVIRLVQLAPLELTTCKTSRLEPGSRTSRTRKAAKPLALPASQASSRGPAWPVTRRASTWGSAARFRPTGQAASLAVASRLASNKGAHSPGSRRLTPLGKGTPSRGSTAGNTVGSKSPRGARSVKRQASSRRLGNGAPANSASQGNWDSTASRGINPPPPAPRQGVPAPDPPSRSHRAPARGPSPCHRCAGSVQPP